LAVAEDHRSGPTNANTRTGATQLTQKEVTRQKEVAPSA
jgi:hypothetical protein